MTTSALYITPYTADNTGYKQSKGINTQPHTRPDHISN